MNAAPLPSPDRSVLRACCHGPEGVELEPALDLEALAAWSAPRPGKVRWLRAQGLAEPAKLQAAAAAFGLHPLAMEDVFHQSQLPKLEGFEHGYMLVLPHLSYAGRLRAEPVTVFLGEDWVLSFARAPLRELDGLEARLQAGRGQVREGGSDWLFYRVLDALVDGYAPVLTAMDQAFAALEERLLGTRPDRAVYGLRVLRGELFRLHTMLRALQVALGALQADREDWLDKKLQPYLKDLSDHVAQALDHVENLREGVAENQQLYHTLLSTRMNEIMRVLTVMSVVFMPLSFLAGLWGMNFRDMPELNARWGYPLALAVMAAVAGALLFMFRRWGWLGGEDAEDLLRPGGDEDGL